MRADLLIENALVTYDGSTDPEQLQYGQLLVEEGTVLRALAANVPPLQVIVEVGSYTGKSAMCLAAGSAEGNLVPVYAVDLWTSGVSKRGRGFRVRVKGEAPSRKRFHIPETLAIFQRRQAVFDTAKILRPIMGASTSVAAKLSTRTGFLIGLLFIDAEHTYEACKADFEAWSPMVDRGGVIALHDYAKPDGSGGVRRYIDEMLGAGSWQIVDRVGSMAVLKRA